MELHETNLKLMCRICCRRSGKKQFEAKSQNRSFVKLTEKVFISKECHKYYCTINNGKKKQQQLDHCFYFLIGNRTTAILERVR